MWKMQPFWSPEYPTRNPRIETATTTTKTRSRRNSNIKHNTSIKLNSSYKQQPDTEHLLPSIDLKSTIYIKHPTHDRKWRSRRFDNKMTIGAHLEFSVLKSESHTPYSCNKSHEPYDR